MTNSPNATAEARALVKALQLHQESADDSRTPFMAIVDGTNGALVRFHAVSASSAGQQWFARAAGQNIQANDVGIAIPIQGGGWIFLKVGGPTDVLMDLEQLRPSPGQPGRIYWPSNSTAFWVDTGSAWIPFGPTAMLGAVPTSGWTWLNQGDATVSYRGAGFVLQAGSNGGSNSVRVYQRAYSGAMDLVVMMQAAIPNKNYHHCGLSLRQNSTSKTITFGPQYGNAIAVQKWDNLTTFNSTLFSVPWSGQFPPYWRIVDTGTQMQFYVGLTGADWNLLATENRGVFTSPDNVGFALNPVNQATPLPGHALAVYSWLQS